jgi:RES domain-containing protein
MELYRIAKTSYISDLSGAGAKMYGGRWNRPGMAMLYTSQARSLAVLELIVHFNSSAALKLDYSFLTLNISENLIFDVDISLLPTNNLNINQNSLWEISENYFLKRDILALRVPSVVISEEFNVLLNPNHSLYKEIIPQKIEKISLDERFGYIRE